MIPRLVGTIALLTFAVYATAFVVGIYAGIGGA